MKRIRDDRLDDPAWLVARYYEDNMTIEQIAVIVGTSTGPVYGAMNRFAIPRRTQNESKKGRPQTREWTPEAREAMAAKRRGELNPMYGKFKERPPVVLSERVGNYNPRHRLRRYGITPMAYDKLLAAQGGVCAACGNPETRRRGGGAGWTGGKRKISAAAPDEVTALAVDHDHDCCPGATSCGKCVRGLVCHRCNVVIGMAKDDAAILQLCILYLSESKKRLNI